MINSSQKRKYKNKFIKVGINDNSSQIIYFSNSTDKIKSWDTLRWFGFIPKPKYINVYKKRLVKPIAKLLALLGRYVVNLYGRRKDKKTI